MSADNIRRKPGRPRAIPEAVIPRLLHLYNEGLGYRVVARELGKQGVYADWSTVRRIVKSRRTVDNKKMTCKPFLTLFCHWVSQMMRRETMDNSNIVSKSKKNKFLVGDSD